MIQDKLTLEALSGIGTILAFFTAMLTAMAIAGIIKDVSGKVRRIMKYYIIPIWLLGFNCTYKWVQKRGVKPPKLRKSLQRQR